MLAGRPSFSPVIILFLVITPALHSRTPHQKIDRFCKSWYHSCENIDRIVLYLLDLCWCRFCTLKNGASCSRKGWTVSERELGIVKWFKDSKGYGFIKRDGGGDVFVHFTAIQMDGHKTLERGQRVEFTVVEESRGLKASRVVPLYTAEEARWARLYS